MIFQTKSYLYHPAFSNSLNRGNNATMGMISRTAKTNPERVAWIGGLEGKTLDKEACKKLKDHIEKLAGEGCKFVSITNKGAGGAIFGSGEEAQQAIAAVNGSKFMGKTLEVDVWTKKADCSLRQGARPLKDP